MSSKTGRRRRPPGDGFWGDIGLIVKYADSQHDKPTPHFDKPHQLTVSGGHRGIQRRIYDERRRTLIARHQLTLVTFPAAAFPLKRDRIARERDRDRTIVGRLLAEAGINLGSHR